MSMVVRNNLSAINTLNMLNRNHSALAKSLQTVSSGMRINGAKDDASGYAISERMRVQIRSLNQDNNNTQNGHSLMKVAEGAVQSTVDILKTLKEKVINAANDTNTDADRQMIQKELNQSIDQINDNALVTYNDKYLLNGSKNGKSEGTFTALTNSSLYEKTTGASRLVMLKDRSGQSLNIQTGDRVTVSYVQEGQTFSSSFTVTETSSLATIMKTAENADATSANPTQTFKPSDPTEVGRLEQAYRDAKSAYETHRDGALKDAQDAVKEYTDAQTALSSAKARMNSYANDSGLRALAVGTSQFGSDYDSWSNETDGIGGYPTPTRAENLTAHKALANIIADPTGWSSDPAVNAVATNFKNSYNGTNGYTTAYNALVTIDGNGSLASRRATLEHEQVISNGLKDDMDNAQAAWEAANAPEIISGPELGTSYFGTIVNTPDFGSALTITANTRGLDGQIAGFTVSVTDTEGNIKKSVNAVLDAWNESIRAENASNDDYALVLQTGTKANQAIKVRMTDMRARALGLMGKDGTTLNVSTQKNANAAINVLDNAIQKALDQQTTIGAIESRLEYTSTNLTTAAENVTASESTIRDADMALAMTQYTKNNILMQASQAMLAQANQSNNQVLSLLR